MNVLIWKYLNERVRIETRPIVPEFLATPTITAQVLGQGKL